MVAAPEGIFRKITVEVDFLEVEWRIDFQHGAI